MGYHLGIDLGTTFTAAALWRDGRSEVVHLGHDTAVIPSVVLVRDSEVVVGDAAARAGLADFDRVAREFKRRLGDPVPLLLGGQPHSAEQLTARLLSHVVGLVTEREGAPADSLVVTHPANWGGYKRELFDQATRLAGVGPVTPLSEPEAAAIHYAEQERVPEGAVVAVYDLGGGTFDAAVLRKRAVGYEFLGDPEGIERLGGVDVDEAVLGHVRRSLGGELDEVDEDDPAMLAAMERLRRECVDAKRALSSDTEVSIPVLLPNLQTEVRLTRTELESYIRTPLQDSVSAMQRALDGAGVKPADVDRFLLVGGSSRIPLVSQLVSAAFGRPVTIDAHPKFAIARGAAAHAAALAGTETDAAGTTAPPAPADLPTAPAAAPPPPAVVTPPTPPTPPPAPEPEARPGKPPADASGPATHEPAEPAAATPPPAEPATPAQPGSTSTGPGYGPPPPAPDPGGSRKGLLIGGAVVLIAIVAGLAFALGGDGGDDTASDDPTSGATSSDGGTDTATADGDVLLSPDAAEAAGAEQLLSLGADLPGGDWNDLLDPAWAGRLGELPVYVADTAIRQSGAVVEADLVVALRGRHADGTADGRVPFRLARAVDDTEAVEVVEVSQDGEPTNHFVDPGGLLVVALADPLGPDEAAAIRIKLRYDVPNAPSSASAGSFEEAGAIATTSETSLLFHWLPTLLHTEYPVGSYGGPDSYPAAYWSVIVNSGRNLVTSGADTVCPTSVADRSMATCVWSRSVGQRAHGAVLTDQLQPYGSDQQAGVTAYGTDRVATELVAAEAANGLAFMEGTWSPLPWTELDFVVTALPAGVAGFVVPGLVAINAEDARNSGGGFGSFVTGVTVGHQLFGGVVGNDEATDPMLSRVLADYTALRIVTELYSEADAEVIYDNFLVGPYFDAASRGIDGRSARALADYGTAEAFNALIHGRGLAPLAIDFSVGDAFLSAVVAEFGLSHGDSTAAAELARSIRGPLASDLEALWFSDITLDEYNGA